MTHSCRAPGLLALRVFHVPIGLGLGELGAQQRHSLDCAVSCGRAGGRAGGRADGWAQTAGCGSALGGTLVMSHTLRGGPRGLASPFKRAISVISESACSLPLAWRIARRPREVLSHVGTRPLDQAMRHGPL